MVHLHEETVTHCHKDPGGVLPDGEEKKKRGRRSELRDAPLSFLLRLLLTEQQSVYQPPRHSHFRSVIDC